MSVVQGKFLNTRLRHEMPKWKQIIWKLFGERLHNTADGWTVTGYRLRNITLITRCEEVEDL